MCSCKIRLDRLVNFVEKNFEQSKIQSNLLFQKVSELEKRTFQKITDIEGSFEKKIFDAQSPSAKFSRIDAEAVKKETQEKNELQVLKSSLESLESKFDMQESNIDKVKADHGNRLSLLEEKANEFSKSAFVTKDHIDKQSKFEETQLSRHENNQRTLQKFEEIIKYFKKNIDTSQQNMEKIQNMIQTTDKKHELLAVRVSNIKIDVKKETGSNEKLNSDESTGWFF